MEFLKRNPPCLEVSGKREDSVVEIGNQLEQLFLRLRFRQYERGLTTKCLSRAGHDSDVKAFDVNFYCCNSQNMSRNKFIYGHNVYFHDIFLAGAV